MNVTFEIENVDAFYIATKCIIPNLLRLFKERNKHLQ